MRVLIVKISSLGDVIHTLPAVTDAARTRPEIRFDWVVEEAFAAIPSWHQAVDRVIVIQLRRWRRNWRRAWHTGEVRAFLHLLRERPYDLVIDAQGLFFKSVLPTLLARGVRAGYDFRTARDRWASITYNRRYAIARELHAIERLRQLFAASLGYELPNIGIDYGIKVTGEPTETARPYLVFLTSTTWTSKHWPEIYWIELTRLAYAQGHQVFFPWASVEDRLRVERILEQAQCGELMPKTDLSGLASQLAAAQGVVGVDSGLAHLTAAMAIPAVTLYGPTSVALTGAQGPRQKNLQARFPCAPCKRRICAYPGESEVKPACFKVLTPHQVFSQLVRQIGRE